MRWSWIVVVACSAPPAPPPAQPASARGPTLEVFAASGSQVRRLAVSLDGVRELARYATPVPITNLEMAGATPALELEDDRIAIVTATGIELLAIPPASTFERSKPTDLDYVATGEQSRMFVRDDEIWYGRCQWGLPNLMGVACELWTDVRLHPAPQEVERDNGDLDRPHQDAEIARPVPPIAPATSIRVALVDDPTRSKVSNNRHDDTTRQKLVCTERGKTYEYPAPGAVIQDQYGHGGYSDLVWLSTEPPIFQVGSWDNCYAPCPSMMTFEGCRESRRFGNASVLLGPSEVIGLHHSGPVDDDRARVTLLWRGKELGTITGADHFGFVPP